VNILITGGAGYIGNVLVAKLFQAKNSQTSLSFYDKLVFDHSDVDYNKLSHYVNFKKLTVFDNLMYRQVCLTDFCYRGDFEFVFGDVRDKTLLLKYIKEADVIIPLAAIVGFPACERDKKLSKQINFEQVKFILGNTSKNQRIIFPNTNSGYGVGDRTTLCTEETPLSPISVYGRTKCAAEKLLLDSGRAIILRLATVFGVSPRMRLDLIVNNFVYKALNDEYIVLFEKNFRRNFIHIQDVALTFISAINNYDRMVGNAFNVGLSDTNLSKLELCEKIKEYVSTFVIKCDDFREDPDKRDYIVSNKKLEKIGWTPYYTLDLGIRELLKAYRIINHHQNKYFTNL